VAVTLLPFRNNIRRKREFHIFGDATSASDIIQIDLRFCHLTSSFDRNDVVTAELGVVLASKSELVPIEICETYLLKT
jgi:hypothetical protein